MKAHFTILPTIPLLRVSRRIIFATMIPPERSSYRAFGESPVRDLQSQSCALARHLMIHFEADHRRIAIVLLAARAKTAARIAQFVGAGTAIDR